MGSKTSPDDTWVNIAGVAPEQPESQKKRQLAKELEMKKLRQACVWSVLFMIVEVVGGYFAGSLAIMTDAAHLLSDVASFGVALFAMSMGKLPPDSRMTWGYQRMEVMGAVISVLIIWVLTAGLLYAAVGRLIELYQSPDGVTVEIVNGKVMTAVATCGLVVNIVLMKILGHHHGHGHAHGGQDHCEHGHSHGNKEHGHSHAHSHVHGHGHSHGHNEHGHQDHKENPAHHHDESPHHKQEDSIQIADHEHDHDHREHHDHHDHHNHHDHHDQQDHHDHHNQDLEPDKKHSHEASLNIRAAYIHALGDFIQSLGVCIAGSIIWINPKLQIADPIVTVLFCFMVLATTHHLMKSSVLIMLEAAPESVDVAEVQTDLEALPSVQRVSRLAVWSLTASHSAAVVHVEVDDSIKNSVALHHRALAEVQQCLIGYGIDVDQVTVQVTTTSSSFEKSESC